MEKFHSRSQKANLKSTQVLAVRFYLLIAFAGITVLFGNEVQVHLTFNAASHIILLTIVTFILPLYCFQQGVLSIGPEKHAIISAFTPAMTYVLQGLMLRHFSTGVMLLSIAMSIFLILPRLKLLKGIRLIAIRMGILHQCCCLLIAFAGCLFLNKLLKRFCCKTAP